MAKVNLKKFSIPELEELQREIEQTIDQRREENRIAVKEEMEKIASDAGFSIDELYGKGKGKKTPLPPKYRNPDDASQTYTGRGRKPGWLADKLAAGADMDDFVIG
ncbi:MAG: H-NS histone family protein [bacterium]|nr:H-NS histone family protein [bacterium]